MLNEVKMFTFTLRYHNGDVFEQTLRLSKVDADCTADLMRADDRVKSVTVREMAEAI